jgi:uncharacterized NAD(P)/FAD-binding protein YdhS
MSAAAPSFREIERIVPRLSAYPGAHLGARSILIVGAGFSGTVLALQLLRARTSAPLHITLVEQGEEFGRGLAYMKSDFPHLLNVPASRMSADSRDPLQFVRFAQERDPAVTGDDFLPRETYGEYL